ncbi:hypothetical protein ZOSMA_1G03470 [Zostera marina]|uniref:Uncharacterized protein n=1 Tax=Zostera marina TaxID=29655 RepID=A0A0K9PQ48_ZOSMR|nr:hypothetical protein ZOSMA_1G03470 [Zostera marina]
MTLTTEVDQNEEHHSQPTPNDTEQVPVPFDPSRMVGIIKRKALIKDLAATYQKECLKCCQELLEHQREWEKVYAQRERERERLHKLPRVGRKSVTKGVPKPSANVAKRSKKTH